MRYASTKAEVTGLEATTITACAEGWAFCNWETALSMAPLPVLSEALTTSLALEGAIALFTSSATALASGRSSCSRARRVMPTVDRCEAILAISSGRLARVLKIWGWLSTRVSVLW